MKKEEIVEKLITSRKNDLSVKSIEVVWNPSSFGNPRITVGTKPYYEWDKVKEMEYVICYGRYLNCSLLVYDKEIRKDKDFTFVKGEKAAVKKLMEILDKITTPKAV